MSMEFPGEVIGELIEMATDKHSPRHLAHGHRLPTGVPFIESSFEDHPRRLLAINRFHLEGRHRPGRPAAPERQPSRPASPALLPPRVGPWVGGGDVAVRAAEVAVRAVAAAA